MRQAVIISRMREGDRCESLGCSFGTVKKEEEGGGRNLRVDWKEAVWAATRGGKAGMGLGGALEVGMEFDVQLSKFIHYFFLFSLFKPRSRALMNGGFVPQLNLQVKRILLARVHSIYLTLQTVKSTPIRTNGGLTHLKGGGPTEMSETARVCGCKVPRLHRSPLCFPF